MLVLQCTELERGKLCGGGKREPSPWSLFPCLGGELKRASCLLQNQGEKATVPICISISQSSWYHYPTRKMRSPRTQETAGDSPGKEFQANTFG